MRRRHIWNREETTPTKRAGGAKARQDWWADTLKLKPDELQEDEEAAAADAEGLRPRF